MRILGRAFYANALGRRARFMSSNCRRTVMSFGDGSHGALGLPTSLMGIGGDAYEPTVVPGLPSDISSVSAGHYHSLAVTSGGALWAWGRNNEAQLGRSLLAPRSIINLWFNFVLIVFFFLNMPANRLCLDLNGLISARNIIYSSFLICGSLGMLY